MFRILIACVLLLAGLVGGARPVGAVPSAVVTDLRVGEYSSQTRFVLELSRSISFQIFTLGDPYRVVVDLPEVGWRLPARPLPRNQGILKRLRYGLFKPGVSRIVLDTAGPAMVRRALLLGPDGEHGHRLVIDLANTSRAAFRKNRKKVTVYGKKTSPIPMSPSSSVVEIKREVSQAKRQISIAAVAFPAPPRKPPLRKKWSKRVVVIDAGHGGKDPGTHGITGVNEKNITLAVARELKRQMEATGRYKAVLTRDRDVFLRLRKRVDIARKVGAELFLSLHADSIKNRKIRGLSVYTLSERASDREAALLAEKENKADLIAGVNLSDESPEVANILIDLAQRETMNQAAYFASGLVGELKREVRLLRNTHRFAGFAVLKAPDIPSVLLELGYLSNSQDERALRTSRYRRKLARAIVRSIDRYFVRVEEASRR